MYHQAERGSIGCALLIEHRRRRRRRRRRRENRCSSLSGFRRDPGGDISGRRRRENTRAKSRWREKSKAVIARARALPPTLYGLFYQLARSTDRRAVIALVVVVVVAESPFSRSTHEEVTPLFIYRVCIADAACVCVSRRVRIPSRESRVDFPANVERRPTTVSF